MKLIFTGLALVLAASSSTAIAQYYGSIPEPDHSKDEQKTQSPDQPPKNKLQPSKKAQQAIVDLQTAVNANDAAAIPAKLAAANAVATTKEDRYWIARLQLKAAVAANDNASASAAIDSLAATGLMPATDIASLYEGMGGTYFKAKQYPQAAAAFQHQLALDPSNTGAMINLAESRAAAGQKAEAVSTLQHAIQAAAAQGKKPEEALYKRALGLAYDAKMANASDLARAWVSAYPSPDSWHDAIAIYRNLNNPDTEGTLDLMRLMQATGSMKAPSDYETFANAAIEDHDYNEAQAVVDAGLAAKAIDPAAQSVSELRADLKTRRKATAADLEAAVKMAPAGPNLLHIADGFYALGQYQRAAGIYRQAMSKSGVDANVANMHLGMALAKAGDKAGAAAAFNAVSGDRAGIAKLWLMYVQQHG